ncbi:hypothetical protein CHS0354_032136 [Potamilus streckersoni]|uniref:Uncharacterized protein n=1 Tax=Potamilus streckersoni TaxID=2493646 RepID=A0AAE0WCW5_9BIVA|nr:hypothetical protein CHS0354_032136 [Potamilus streckersoni]
MATASRGSSAMYGQECPICLNVFTSPRQLPCLHCFCEQCLQDCITSKATGSTRFLEEFLCPVCSAVTKVQIKDRKVGECVSLFPYSPFPLVGKSKVDRLCEVCSYSSHRSNNIAKTFCVICEEFMCDDCSLYHKNMKMSKSHQVITTDEWESKSKSSVRYTVGFGCPEHDCEDLKFYCKTHGVACCGTCAYLHHNRCKDVLELKQNLPDLLVETNPLNIMEELQTLEDHLRKFLNINEEEIIIMESKITDISAKIGEIRKKIIAMLDDIEIMVKTEGNRIYKDWVNRKQEQNHQCQSLLNAVQNSNALLETISKHGTDMRKFFVASKTMNQLLFYHEQVREKFGRIEHMKINIKLDKNMKAVLSKDVEMLVKIECHKEVKDFHGKIIMKPLRERSVELSRVIDIDCPSRKNPVYTGIVQLPEGEIMLIDCSNDTCCLYDSSYNFITSHTLPGHPSGICMIGNHGVAIAMPAQKAVQFLLISDRSIRDTGTVTTRYRCYGLDVADKEEIVVSGPCSETSGSRKCYWSLITREGEVKVDHKFDCRWTYEAFVALDTTKYRIYVSVSGGNAVYCFGLNDGEQYFVYVSNDLKFPLCVAVDREDNVYVVGYSSNNIHKLSPDGVTLQIITSGVAERPTGISFNHNRDFFLITNQSQMERQLQHFEYT